MDITDREFEQMRGLIYQRFGINLTEQKKSLLVGRLQKIMQKSSFTSFGQYYQHLINDPSEQGLSGLIDHISTNHTYFNREKAHFEFFAQQALPTIVNRLQAEGRRDLRIWCAGCSSGEEPYMLLMLMHELLGKDYPNWDAGILATDISKRALDRAQSAVYQDNQVAPLPQEFKRKYLRRQADGSWIVCEELRREATFRRFNLMNDKFPFRQPFHLIFCRNVMIYFDQQTRDKLVTSFHRAMAPQGYLFVGHAESLNRNLGLYSFVKPAVYQKI